MANGRDIASIIDAKLVPGGQLLVRDVASRSTMFAVNADGYLLNNHLASPRSNSYVDASGQLVPGSDIAMLDQDRLFAIDRTGTIRGYRIASGRWLREDPTSVAGRRLSGFAPGGSITSLRVPSAGGVAFAHHLVTVDSLGRLQLLYEPAGAGRANPASRAATGRADCRQLCTQSHSCLGDVGRRRLVRVACGPRRWSLDAISDQPRLYAIHTRPLLASSAFSWVRH
ncbi:MAG: hypothetical protein CMJ64_11150 [Planctomycetaceae bacterium]|nr:hypothetical protein [Planctomycetaceae bacterium]